MSNVVYERVALIGLGLIASSMFWAIKRGGWPEKSPDTPDQSRPVTPPARSGCVIASARARQTL